MPRVIQTQEPRNSRGQDPSSFCLHLGADPVPQLNIPKFLPESTGLPGVLIHRHQEGQATSEAARPVNTTGNQITRGKVKDISKRNQGYVASSEPRCPTVASPGCPKH